jgi:hypothetical protein
MLRLIGAIVVVVLIVGPLLLQAGLLDNAGAFRELVELEVRIFTEFVDWARLQMTRI